MPLDQLSVLKLVTSRLDAHGIPYMTTGSIASGHYAQPRMTRDIDLVVDLSPPDADRVCDIFRDSFECEAEAVRSAIAQVDFVVRKDTPYRIEEFRRRRLTTIDGQSMWIVSPEDLLLSKLAWGRDSGSELQLRDARQLVAAQPTLDWDYMKRWAPQIGVSASLAELQP